MIRLVRICSDANMCQMRECVERRVCARLELERRPGAIKIWIGWQNYRLSSAFELIISFCQLAKWKRPPNAVVPDRTNLIDQFHSVCQSIDIDGANTVGPLPNMAANRFFFIKIYERTKTNKRRFIGRRWDVDTKVAARRASGHVWTRNGALNLLWD